MENKCKNCGTILQGRSDKIYCDNYCKSAYQYKNEKENIPMNDFEFIFKDDFLYALISKCKNLFN